MKRIFTWVILVIIVFNANAQTKCWKMVAGGDDFTVAIKDDGTLWAWGDNSTFVLGAPPIVNNKKPTQIGTDNDWVKVIAHYNHAYAIKSNGTLWSWGDNPFGELGDGTTTSKNKPTQVGTDNKWKDLSDGMHRLALKTDGTLWAWGNNLYGQLGDGTTIKHTIPARVGTDSNWKSIAAGWYFSLAIKNDGSLWAWGGNNSGTVGDGTTVNRSVPTRIGLDTNWVEIAAGAGAYGIKSNGTLWAWGYNPHGQLGTGDTLNRNVPTRIGLDSNWLKLSTDMHTLALKKNGSLWACGWNSSGMLGNGSITDVHNFIQVSTDTTWSSIATPTFSSAAIKSNGSLWTSGRNYFGDLGLGDTTDRHVFTQLATCPISTIKRPSPALYISQKDTSSCSSSVEIPVYGRNLYNISKLKGTIMWDTSVISFGSIRFSNSIGLDSTKFNYSNTVGGYLGLAWKGSFSYNVLDSAALFTLSFLPKQLSGGSFISFDTSIYTLEIDTAMNIAAKKPSYNYGYIIFRDSTKIIQINDSTLICLAGCAPIHYQWYLNGLPINGDTSNTVIINGNGTYTVTVSYRNGLTVHTQPISVIVPVTLNNFTATRMNEIIKLKWQTTTETNVSYFNIQRSTNGKEFITIGNQIANNKPSYYSYNDVYKTNIEKLFYRLEIIDKNGSRTYSDVKSINMLAAPTKMVIYPNPAKESITIDGEGIQQIIISDMEGRIVRQTANPLNQSINIISLSKGLYIVKAITNNNSVYIEKFIKD